MSRATAKPRPVKTTPRKTQPGEVRIIGGEWKRSKLPVPAKDGLRPTPDRVRETLFNWLGQDMTGLRVLDAFAGTGALGLEAASRGAASVLLVEQDATLAAALRSHVARLKATAVQVQGGDGLRALQSAAPGSVDVIFIDPPYQADLLGKALSAAARALSPQGFVYAEDANALPEDTLSSLGLTVHRYLKAGAVHAHLLRHAQ